MKTEERRICPSCGNEFSGAVEFCPVCMLHGALASGGECSESFAEDAALPTSEYVTQRFEHYELAKGEDGKPVELGRGAMGITYKAFDVDLRCPVTLKVISEKYLGDESARLRFLREARAAASVRHPNVASVFHLGKSGGNYFYAMEFVAGETIESLIKRSGRLEVKLALEIATQAAAGLAAVHKQKLVHRDIKPSNIMVSLDGAGAVTAIIATVRSRRRRWNRRRSATLFFGDGTPYRNSLRVGKRTALKTSLARATTIVTCRSLRSTSGKISVTFWQVR